MKRVGLLRHAKSDWSDHDKRDFDRGLNERGRQGARLMGRHIRSEGTQWSLIRASSAERVRRTVEAALPGAEIAFDQRLYLASAETMAELIADLPDEADAVLLVAHNPGLQDLILKLVAPDRENALFDAAKEKFPTASYAVIELPAERWANVAEESGTLVHFTRPRDLDPELGPGTD